MYKILCLGVKGGTGKSTCTANLGLALLHRGFRVGFLDIDLSGANLPAALGMPEQYLNPHGCGVDIENMKRLLPIKHDGYEIFSLAFMFGTAAMLHGDEKPGFVGTGRYNLVKQMLATVQFGELDYLLVDNPPSSGSEVLSLYDNMPDIHGCILVSQPTNLSVEDMVRALDMIEEKHLPLIGMVGNMVEAVCPCCGGHYYPFTSPAVDLEKFCQSRGIPYLVSIPMTPDKAVLQLRFSILAEKVITQKPVKIWQKSFKDRLEDGIVDSVVMGVLKGVGKK
jgi:ATP-binding protein involved in chromosome partitioning